MKLRKQFAVVSLAAVVAGTVTLVSCTKDYVCKCTLTSGSSSVTSQTYDLGKKKRSEAKAECDNKESSIGSLVYSCELE
ncbi:MAG: hypothetical protein KF744_05945 [Taibaiella sp.]|nr:hypothetical protein [Taibaiella sp.]